MRLKDKIALITGSARGIGKTTTELFYKEGATVIISDIRDKEGKALAQKLGEGAEYIHLDVGLENSWVHAFEFINSNYRPGDCLFVRKGGHSVYQFFDSGFCALVLNLYIYCHSTQNSRP